MRPSQSDRREVVLTVEVVRDTLDGGFNVRAPEAPGCVGQGETIIDALTNWTEAFLDWGVARAISAMPVPGTPDA